MKFNSADFIFARDMQLMTHDFDDEPKMAEKGTSVSPGLRSFVSLEKTEVLTLIYLLSFLSMYFCNCT